MSSEILNRSISNGQGGSPFILRIMLVVVREGPPPPLRVFVDRDKTPPSIIQSELNSRISLSSGSQFRGVGCHSSLVPYDIRYDEIIWSLHKWYYLSTACVYNILYRCESCICSRNATRHRRPLPLWRPNISSVFLPAVLHVRRASRTSLRIHRRRLPGCR